MTTGAKPPAVDVGGAVFEVDTFDWTDDGRIEVTGVWSGLRGVRFLRPTLVVGGAGQQRRLLAVLDHKPWAPHEAGQWVAAFDWRGEPVEIETAELNVAPGLDIELPPPGSDTGAARMKRRPGQRAP